MNVPEVIGVSAAASSLVTLLVRPFITGGPRYRYRATRRVADVVTRAWANSVHTLNTNTPQPRRERCPAYPAPGLQCWRYTHDTGRHFIDPAELAPLGYERRPF